MRSSVVPELLLATLLSRRPKVKKPTDGAQGSCCRLQKKSITVRHKLHSSNRYYDWKSSRTTHSTNHPVHACAIRPMQRNTPLSRGNAHGAQSEVRRQDHPRPLPV